MGKKSPKTGQNFRNFRFWGTLNGKSDILAQIGTKIRQNPTQKGIIRPKIIRYSTTMKILPEKEEFLRNTIRDAIAANPLVTIRRMQEIVEQNTGRAISDKYVARLMHKIRRQAVIQSDRKKMNERLAEVRERYRLLMDDLMRTVYWKPEFLEMYALQPPSFKERLAAMKLLAQMELALFRAELDAGLFENRQTAIYEMLQQGVLPTELREQVIGAFRTWKLTPVQEEGATSSNLSVMPNADTP